MSILYLKMYLCNIKDEKGLPYISIISEQNATYTDEGSDVR